MAAGAAAGDRQADLARQAFPRRSIGTGNTAADRFRPICLKEIDMTELTQDEIDQVHGGIGPFGIYLAFVALCYWWQGEGGEASGIW